MTIKKEIKFGFADDDMIFDGFIINDIKEGSGGWDTVFVTEEQYMIFLEYISLDRISQDNPLHYILNELFFSYGVDSPKPNKEGLFRLDGFQVLIIDDADADDDDDDDDLQDKCFCDFCDDFIETAECETLEIEDIDGTNFEVACSACYNELYKNI